MVQNTLKQQARSFMERHDVSYSTALRAVDEPLHELRDLLGVPRFAEFAHAMLFRIVPRDNLYGDAFIEERKLRLSGEIGRDTRFRYPIAMHFMEEAVRRSQLFKQNRVLNIWLYRELYRAGLTVTGSPNLEPVFHHYQLLLGPGFAAMANHGRELGIYGVCVDEFLNICHEPFPHIPVREDQLKALAEGKPAGLIEGFRYSTKDSGRDSELWTDSYRSTAISELRGTDHNPRLTIFSKMSRDGLAEKIEAMGMNPHRFVISELAEDERELELKHWSTSLTVLRGGKRIADGSTERILLWD